MRTGQLDCMKQRSTIQSSHETYRDFGRPRTATDQCYPISQRSLGHENAFLDLHHVSLNPNPITSRVVEEKMWNFQSLLHVIIWLTEAIRSWIFTATHEVKLESRATQTDPPEAVPNARAEVFTPNGTCEKDIRCWRRLRTRSVVVSQQLSVQLF